VRRLRLPRIRRPARALVLVAVLLAIAGAVAAVVESGVLGGSSPGNAGADNPYPTSLTTVDRGSLSEQTQVSATLGYADPSTIVIPAGTAPSDLQQGESTLASDENALRAARANLATDGRTLAEARSLLEGARAKETVDCGGDNAAQTASTGTGGASPTPCATDQQGVATDEQAVVADTAKIASDEQVVQSATTGLGSAQSSLVTAQSSASLVGPSSTYTALPALGRVVGRGQTLYSISGQPILLMIGSVAQWRAFAPGMPAGPDIAELNANLRALGYGDLDGDAFTGATAAAIDALQAARGLAETGELLLGSVVFEPWPVRVTSVTPTLGQTVQAGPVLGITSTRRVVTIELDAAQQSELKVGDAVVITLPDNSTTPGRVSYVGSVATVPSSSDQANGGSDTPTIEVDVTPTHPAATGRLDQAPVTVSITTASVRNVLYVPVDALLALSSGGYAVEVVTAGVHHLVGVQLGLFDDASGNVQVSGAGLSAGQRVVIPNE
jgi:Putative peptidoglycan binding domain/HlyD family secretion protein